MNSGEICSRPQHSVPPNEETESRVFPAANNILQTPLKHEVSGESVADTRMPRLRTEENAGRKIEIAVTYMLQHLDKPLDMSTVSRWIGVSPSTFYHLFKRATGYTPNDFLIRTRMQRACGLLRDSDLAIKQVAALLGYLDQFYFSRIFKSVIGIPPRTYRTMSDKFDFSNAKTIPVFSASTKFEFPSSPNSVRQIRPEVNGKSV